VAAWLSVVGANSIANGHLPPPSQEIGLPYGVSAAGAPVNKIPAACCEVPPSSASVGSLEDLRHAVAGLSVVAAAHVAV
jgi:hypothetical protein